MNTSGSITEWLLVSGHLKNKRAYHPRKIKLRLVQVDNIPMTGNKNLGFLQMFAHYSGKGVTDNKLALELGVRYFGDLHPIQIRLKSKKEDKFYTYELFFFQPGENPVHRTFKTDRCFDFLGNREHFLDCPELLEELAKSSGFMIEQKNYKIQFEDSLGKAEAKFCFITNKLISFTDLQDHWNKRRGYYHGLNIDQETEEDKYKREANYLKLWFNQYINVFKNVASKISSGDFKDGSKKICCDYIRQSIAEFLWVVDSKMQPLLTRRLEKESEMKELEGLEDRKEAMTSFLGFIENIRTIHRANIIDELDLLESIPSYSQCKVISRHLEVVIRYLFWPENKDFWLMAIDDNFFEEIKLQLLKNKEYEQECIQRGLPWRYSTKFLPVMANLFVDFLYSECPAIKSVQFGSKGKTPIEKKDCCYWHSERNNSILLTDKSIDLEINGKREEIFKVDEICNLRGVKTCISHEALYFVLKAREQDQPAQITEVVRVDIGSLKSKQRPIINSLESSDKQNEILAFHSSGELLAILEKGNEEKLSLSVHKRNLVNNSIKIVATFDFTHELLSSNINRSVGDELRNNQGGQTSSYTLFCSGQFIVLCIDTAEEKIGNQTLYGRRVVCFKLAVQKLQVTNKIVDRFSIQNAERSGRQSFSHVAGIEVGKYPALLTVNSELAFNILAVIDGRLVETISWSKGKELVKKLLPHLSKDITTFVQYLPRKSAISFIQPINTTTGDEAGHFTICTCKLNS